MKTINTTPANTSRIRARIHSLMAIAGVMTAVICSLVFMQETQPEHATKKAGLFETSKVRITHQIVKTENFEVVSIIAKLVRL